MKIQVRKGVFETNSSSTHVLTVYTKSDWEDFKNGNRVIDEGWRKSKKVFKTKDEIRQSDEFKEYLKDNYDKEIGGMNEDELDEAMAEFMADECIFDYNSYIDRYEVLQEAIPDSDYIAVSIFRYEG